MAKSKLQTWLDADEDEYVNGKGKTTESAPTTKLQEWLNAGDEPVKKPQTAVQTAEPEKTGIWNGIRNFVTTRRGEASIGAAQQWVADESNSLTALYDAGTGGRSQRSSELLSDWQNQLSTQQQYLRGATQALKNDHENPELREHVTNLMRNVEDLQTKISGLESAQGADAGTVQAAYQASGNLSQKGQQHIENAKEGLGPVGSRLVDAGAQMTQQFLDEMGAKALGFATVGTGKASLLNDAIKYAPFVARSFGGGAKKAYDNGATGGQAAMYGTYSAAKEYIMEKLLGSETPFKTSHGGTFEFANGVSVEGLVNGAIDRFVSKLPEGVAQTISRAGLTGSWAFISEFLEEFGGNMLDWMTQADRIYGGQPDTFTEYVQSGIDEGLTAGLSALLGFPLSGAIERGNEIKAAKAEYGSDPSGLVAETAELAPDSKIVKNAQSRLDAGKKLSGNALRNLSDLKQKATTSADIDLIRNSAAERLRALGETGNVDAIADAITRSVVKRSLGQEETIASMGFNSVANDRALRDSKYGQRVLNELDPKNIMSQTYESGWAENIGTKRINPAAYTLTGKIKSAAEAAAETRQAAAAEAEHAAPPAQNSARDMVRSFSETLGKQEQPVQEQRSIPARLATDVEVVRSGNELTGNEARRIMADGDSMQTLRDAGVLEESVKPGAEGRRQVINAVRAFSAMQSSTAAETAENAAQTVKAAGTNRKTDEAPRTGETAWERNGQDRTGADTDGAARKAPNDWRFGESGAESGAEKAETPVSIRRQMVRSFAETLGKQGQTAMERMYAETQSQTEYVKDFARIYNAAQSGKLTSTANLESGTLTAPQAQAAFLAGAQDAGLTVQETVAENGGTVYTVAENDITGGVQNERTGQIREGIPAGEDAGGRNGVSGNGGRRNGADPGLQSGGISAGTEGAEGAGRVYAGGNGTAAGRAEKTDRRAHETAAEKITRQDGRTVSDKKESARSLGAKGGSTEETLSVVNGGYTESDGRAKRIAGIRGLDLVLTVGGRIRVKGTKARGVLTWYNGRKRIIAQCDDGRFDSYQITKHECGHDLIDNGEIDADRLFRQFQKREDFHEVMALYLEKYQKSGMTVAEVWDEIVCDAIGSMNAIDNAPADVDVDGFLYDLYEAARRDALERHKPTESASAFFEAIDGDAEAGMLFTAESRTEAGTDTGQRFSSIQNGRERKTMENNRFERLRQFHDDLPPVWYAYTRDNFYVYENESFMDYKVLSVIHIAENRERIRALERKIRNGDFRTGRTYHQWIEDLRNEERGYSGDSSDGSKAGKPVEAGELSGYDYRRSARQGRNHESGGDVQGLTSEEKNGQKFSMAEPVEETKDLLALHNLTEKNLLDSIKLGGLPMPSIAVVKAEAGHSKYGPISIVFGKRTIDPKADRRNKVYGSDAWTPTAQQIGYEANGETESRISDKFRDIEKKYGRTVAEPLYRFADGLEDKLSQYGGEQGIIERLESDTEMMNAFLADSGKEPVSLITREVRKTIPEGKIAQYNAVIQALGEETFREFAKRPGETYVEARRRWQAQYGEALREAYRQFLLETIPEEAVNALMDDPAFSVDKLTTEIAIPARNYLRNGAETVSTETDIEATKQAIREKTDKAEYRKWLEELFKGAEKRKGIYNGKDPYTANGNRRSFRQLYYPYELEYIVKAMKETQAARGQGSLGVGAGTLQAVASPEYKSISEVKSDKGRLGAVDEEAYSKALKQVDSGISSVMDAVRNQNPARNGNSFIQSDNIASALKEAAKGSKTASAITKSFSEYGLKLDADTVRQIQQLYEAAAALPTEYFEAKPQRAVGFDEALAVVTPENSSEELLRELRAAGANVLTYEAGNEADRLEKINSVEGARFSSVTEEERGEEDERDRFGSRRDVRGSALDNEGGIRGLQKAGGRTDRDSREEGIPGRTGKRNARFEDSEGRPINPETAAKLRKTKITDSSGRPIPVYHSTDRKFDIFENGDIGFHFGTKTQADSLSIKKEYVSPITIRAYLNLENPLYCPTDQFTWRPAMAAYTLCGKNLIEYSEFEEVVKIAQKGDGYGSPASVLLRNILESKGYDGIVYENMFEADGKSYIAFYDSQIIRAPIDAESGTEDQTARFSTVTDETEQTRQEKRKSELTRLRERNAELEELLRQEKAQSRKDTDRESFQRTAKEVVRDILKTLDSRADAAGVAAGLNEIAEAAGTEDSRTVRQKAQETARNILRQAAALNRADLDGYKRAAELLKGTKIGLPGAQREGMTMDDLREELRGTGMTVRTDGTPAAEVYAAMQDALGKEYLPDLVNTPLWQVRQIAGVMKSLKPAAEAEYSVSMAAAVEYLGNDLTEIALSIRHGDSYADLRTIAGRAASAAKTAGKAAKRSEKAKEKARQRGLRLLDEEYYNRMLRSVQAEQEERIAKVKRGYAEARERERSRKEASAERERLLKTAQRLKRIKTTRVNRALIEELIGELDTVSVSMTGKSVRELEGLREWYAEQRENNPDFIENPAIERKLNRLSRKKIAEMTLDDVRELNDVLRNVENELRNHRKLIDEQDARDTYLLGQDIIEHVNGSAGSRADMGDLIANAVLTPERAVRRITGYVEGDPLYRATKRLSDGQRTMLDFQRRAQKMFQRFADDKAFQRRIKGKHAEKITIRGYQNFRLVDVDITPDMRMALYLHSLNSQNLRHMGFRAERTDGTEATGGGVTIPDLKLLAEGKTAEAYARGTTVKLTPSLIRMITEEMTETEKDYAMAAWKYFNSFAPDAVNEVSEKLVGYSLAQVSNYFPLNVNTDFTRSDFESIARDGSIEGMGFLKERVEAQNPILLRGLTDVLNQSIRMNSKYVGMAIPVRNFNKLWNVSQTIHNEAGDKAQNEDSVAAAVKRKWGVRGADYIENFLRDVQNPVSNNGALQQFLEQLRGNYAGAVLDFNAGVAIKQAASYPTAAAVVGWKPLIKALGNVSRADTELIARYTPLLWYRSLGFSDVELGDIRAKGRRNNRPKALNWIQAIDVMTTRKLWKAAEYYIRSSRRELTIGTDEYYRATAEIYNRIIEETQPNYTTMQRPAILRSSDSLTRMLNSFKTQPFQNANIFLDALGNYNAKRRAVMNGGSQEAFRESKRQLARAASSLIVSGIIFSAMQWVWDALRKKDDKYRDEDGEKSLLHWLKGMGLNLASNFAGMLPFGGEALEAGELLADGIMKKLDMDPIFGSNSYYGEIGVSAIDSLNGVTGDIESVVTSLAEVAGTLSSGEDVNWESTVRSLYGSAEGIAQFYGIPAANVRKDLEAIAVNVFEPVFGDLAGYYALRVSTDPSRKSAYYDYLYSIRNDTKTYNKVKDMMLEEGYTQKNIDAAMKSREKKAEEKKEAKKAG